jgi:phenylacetate-coenzyme A ligase PaaK-like adenylate-forming protein
MVGPDAYQIEETYGVKAFDVYGLSEIIGRGWRASAPLTTGSTSRRIILHRDNRPGERRGAA